MSNHDPSFAKDTIEAEAVFHLNELFYSRTDERGVMRAGNSVFNRVSGYDWDALIGAPHKLVRHPDMPKGVFHLFWERLKAGKATGAYVKNRRKCGRYYWVFAVAAPSQDGFISTRLKPSFELHASTMEMYASLLTREQEEGLTPEASAAALLEMLADAGFPNYDAFQSRALAGECETRSKQLGRVLDPVQHRFLEMARAVEQVQTETHELTEAFKAIRTVPMNMRIIASRLENAGGPISAISSNYSQMLEEMTSWVTNFASGEKCVFARIRESILQGQFLGFSCAVDHEMADSFQKEKTDYPDTINVAEEVSWLEGRYAQSSEQTREALSEVETQAKRFARSVLDMKRYVTGLSSARMMCKIESAALANSGTELTGIVEQLDACQNEIEARLARIVELNAVVQGNTVMLRSLM